MQPIIHFPMINVTLICNLIPDYAAEIDFILGGRILNVAMEEKLFWLCNWESGFEPVSHLPERELHDILKIKLSGTIPPSAYLLCHNRMINSCESA